MTANMGRRSARGTRQIVLATAIAGMCTAVGVAGCALFQNEQVSRGKDLYAHYCSHCHGENGRQNEGYNWGSMPDPRPKDLSAKAEMSTFKDEEIFTTISRDMKDTSPEGGEKIGDDEFAVPTMPTFKYTLSEEEIWAIVAYVRTLHGMKLTYDLEGRKKELQDQLQTAQQNADQAKQNLEAAEKKATEEAEKKETEVDDEAYAKEQAAFGAASKDLEKAKSALASFSSRPKLAAVQRPDLAMPAAESAKLAGVGKRLYSNKYGCNACHRVGEEGGVVGPALDRAGFRLNPTWVYRWVKYPQSMKPETRMPNLGLSDPDAKAVAMYLNTLRSPRPESPATGAKPMEKASN
ncbi:MAG TPA: c-type cytochrome [Nitrospiraceae bacterium]|nr:c-type cytochrome [Nitrospiraceae bacterium]